ncbi:MAG: group II truncated hemoglobin [Candidatus Sericytochromatia bacterium]
MSEEKLPTVYDEIGGEKTVKELVKYFYDIMDSNNDFKTIREQHHDLEISREKLFMFLSGWLGGPSLYVEKYGHPRLRARHMPFPIGTKERDQWVNCMALAFEKIDIKKEIKRELLLSLANVADFMRNKND